MLWIHVTTCVSCRHFVRAARVHACMLACPCVCTCCPRSVPSAHRVATRCDGGSSACGHLQRMASAALVAVVCCACTSWQASGSALALKHVHRITHVCSLARASPVLCPLQGERFLRRRRCRSARGALCVCARGGGVVRRHRHVLKSQILVEIGLEDMHSLHQAQFPLVFPCLGPCLQLLHRVHTQIRHALSQLVVLPALAILASAISCSNTIAPGCQFGRLGPGLLGRIRGFRLRLHSDAA